MRTKAILAAAAIGVAGLISMAADAPKTFKPDAEGFILNWLILDPIALVDVDHVEDVEKPMFAKEYFKDQLSVRPKAEDKVTVAGKELRWHEYKSGDYEIDLAQFAADHSKDPDSCLYFGVVYVTAPDELKDVRLAIGSDDSSVWWVNGKEVARAYAARAVNQDDDISKPLTLSKGLNVVRFAVIQGDGPTGACARFLDAASKPVKNLTITLEAPAASTMPAPAQ